MHIERYGSNIFDAFLSYVIFLEFRFTNSEEYSFGISRENNVFFFILFERVYDKLSQQNQKFMKPDANYNDMADSYWNM